jgi:hypothetical protein
MLLVLGSVSAACGGKKSTTQGTPTSAAVRTPGAPGTAQSGAAASQNATTPAAGSSAAAGQTPGTPGTAQSGAAASQNATTPGAGSSAAAANQTPGDAGTAVGAGGTPAGGDTVPGSPSATPAYTVSTPSGGDASTPVAPASTAVSVGPAGGAIAIGAASLVGGNVEVAVNVTGTGIPAFTAYQIHLRWNPSIFKFGSARSAGTILPGSVVCPTAVADADGAGVFFACTAVGGAETTSPGLLGTIVLTPVGTGCSPLHLFTDGGADAGDEATGTYTMDKTTKVALTVTADGSADQAGQHC